MDTRERFLAIMRFEAVAPPKWEFGYWAATIHRWYGEGLPRRKGIPDDAVGGEAILGPGGAWYAERVRDEDAQAACGLDLGLERVPVDSYFWPRFREEILEEHDSWMLRRDEYGVVRKEPRDRTSVPRYVAWPVHGRDDWERLLAERLRPTLQGRLPADWTAEKERLRGRHVPLAIGGGHCGFYGALRDLLGGENLLVSYYDNPGLLKTIIGDLCAFWITLWDQVLDEIDVDLALLWEDMCYKTGPLISPALVREFMLPAYKRLTGFLRDRGVHIVLLDTDGDCRSLIPLFLEGGITGLYPFEVNAGMDVVAVRQAFPRLQMLGGLDKMALAAGPAAIDRELDAKVPAMLRVGGYVPYIDHMVPPDVSWANFAYYRQRLNGMIES